MRPIAKAFRERGGVAVAIEDGEMDVCDGGDGGELDMEARLSGVGAGVGAQLKSVRDSASDILRVGAWVEVLSALEIGRSAARDDRRAGGFGVAARSLTTRASVGSRAEVAAALWCGCRAAGIAGEGVCSASRAAGNGSKTAANQRKAGKGNGDRSQVDELERQGKPK